MAKQQGFLTGLIMEGTRFEGKLTFQNKMRIDGEFVGQIESKDQLIVGEAAKIDAEISVGELVVMGEVKGKIKHCDNLQITEAGRIIGDITVKTLEIKPGGVFEGNCVMIKNSHSNDGKGSSK